MSLAAPRSSRVCRSTSSSSHSTPRLDRGEDVNGICTQRKVPAKRVPLMGGGWGGGRVPAKRVPLMGGGWGGGRVPAKRVPLMGGGWGGGRVPAKRVPLVGGGWAADVYPHVSVRRSLPLRRPRRPSGRRGCCP